MQAAHGLRPCSPCLRVPHTEAVRSAAAMLHFLAHGAVEKAGALVPPRPLCQVTGKRGSDGRLVTAGAAFEPKRLAPNTRLPAAYGRGRLCLLCDLSRRGRVSPLRPCYVGVAWGCGAQADEGSLLPLLVGPAVGTSAWPFPSARTWPASPGPQRCRRHVAVTTFAHLVTAADKRSLWLAERLL